MFDPKIANDITKQFVDNLPPAFKEMNSEFEKTLKLILQNTFAKLELVTREEFDAQTKVLARTREKLEHLEREVMALEKRLNEVD